MSPMFNIPTILQSKAVYANGLSITSFDLTIRWSGGNLRFFYGTSSAENTPPTTWTEVTPITSGVEQTITVIGGDSFLFYKIVKDKATFINSTIDSYGRLTQPALRIRNIAEA